MKATNFLLTIVFPTYNREETVLYALDSLINNISSDSIDLVEVLILDNKSKDNTAGIIEHFISDNAKYNIRLIKHDQNYGYDLNYYKGYCEAKGKYLWFCSDRYIYNVNISNIIHAVQENVVAITFGSVLRKNRANNLLKTIEDAYSINEVRALEGEIIKKNNQYYKYVKVSQFHKNNYNKLKGKVFIANVSDCIIRKDEDQNWQKKLEEYDYTHMLVIAAMIRAFENMDKDVAIIMNPSFSLPFNRITSSGCRHDALKVAYGNVKLANDFKLVDTYKDICLFQTGVLTSRKLNSTVAPKLFTANFNKKDLYDFVRSCQCQIPLVYKIWIDIVFFPLPRFIFKQFLKINKYMTYLLKKHYAR